MADPAADSSAEWRRRPLLNRTPMREEAKMDAHALTRKKSGRARLGPKLTPGVKVLLDHLLPALAKNIYAEGAPSPPRGLGPAIRGLSTDELALSALWPILRERNRRHPYADTLLCMEIGRNVCDRRLLKKLDRKGRAKVTKEPGKYAWRFLRPDWTDEDCIGVGNWLVRCALQLTFFELDDHNLPKIATEHEPYIAELYEALVWRDPVYLPHKKVPPDWTGWRVWYSDRISGTFVKSNYDNTRPAIEVAFVPTPAEDAVVEGEVVHLEPAEFEHAKGVNSLQRVPLRINPFMLRLVERLRPDVRADDHGRGPIAPDCAVASYLADAPFWITYRCDRRGRLIPLPHFNFSREDHVRSLFMFDRGLPLGANVHWLEIHCANCHGETDKLPWQDRLDWVVENRKLIRHIADDPEGTYDTWRRFEAPFRFAAACRELVSAWDEGSSFITRLPTSWDGSNNGTQHYACLLRDAETGAKVNLTASDSVADVYKEIVDRVQLLLEDDNSEAAAWWRECFDRLTPRQVRKLVKTPAGTFAYGATPSGMAEQIAKVYQDLVGEGHFPTVANGMFLGRLIIQAAREVLPRCARAMEWIRARADDCTKRGVALEWVSPTGFPCSNRYQEIKTRRVEIIRDRIALKRKVAVGHTAKINARKAADSAAANFVHSCDASHLIRTALACANEEIDLLTVHDSFSTVASNARRLHQILRAQLAIMHIPNLLARLGENPPERRDLDLIGIQNAEFTFA
jgi:DNA-dependent RNA polymerase